MVVAFTIYVTILVCSYVFIVIRNIYLIRVKLRRYMINNHGVEWNAMLSKPSMIWPEWADINFNKTISDFIWRSDVDFGDPNVKAIKRQIRRIILEALIIIVAILLLIPLMYLDAKLKWL